MKINKDSFIKMIPFRQCFGIETQDEKINKVCKELIASDLKKHYDNSTSFEKSLIDRGLTGWSRK